MPDNKPENYDLWKIGEQLGRTGGSMPSYQDTRDTYGPAAANWLWGGHEEGRTQSLSDQNPSGQSSSGK